MTARSFAVPAISAAPFDTAVWNALISYSGHALPMAAQNVYAQFELLDVAPLSAPGLLVSFGRDDHAVFVITSFPFKRVFDAEFSIQDLQTLPIALRDALNEGILGMVWSALPEHDLGPCMLVESGGSADLAPKLAAPPTWFAVTISGLFQEPVAFVIACSADRLVEHLARKQLAPRRVWPALRTQITADMFVTIGRMLMPVSQVRGLQPGDVVVLLGGRLGRRSIRVGACCHEFEESGSGWAWCAMTRFTPGAEKGTFMEQISNSAAALDDLQVAIDFDIGQRSVSLAEIESWQRGAIVSMDLPAPEAGLEVTVRANGRVLATGDLVRIDDRLAVRLSRLLIGAGAQD